MGNHLQKPKPPLTPEEQSIEAFVNALLRDANINATFLPDNVEKEIYINILKIILGNLKSIVDSIRLEVLHHVITIKMEPKEEEKSEN